MKNTEAGAESAADPSRALPVSRYIVFVSIALFGCLADLISKSAVFAWLGMPSAENEHTWWLIENYVGIQTAINQGALFGMGQGWGFGFALLSFAAAGGIVYWLFARRAARDLLLTIALASVTAGILGNLYDRLGMWHPNPVYEAVGLSLGEVSERDAYGVRDWILLQYGDAYTWPNFNIADSMLVCGAGLLLWHALFRGEKTAGGQGKPAEKKKPARSAA